MANKILVKVNSINHLSDARYFAAHEVEWLGYCFDPDSPDFIQLLMAKGIIDWVVGPKVVAEFGDQPSDEIAQVINYINPDFVQLPSTFSILEFDFHKSLIIQISFSEPKKIEEEMMKWKERANIFMLNTEEIRLLDDLKKMNSKFQCLINHRRTGQNIIQIVHQSGALGICINGSSEEKTGIKNYEELDELFESITNGISNT